MGENRLGTCSSRGVPVTIFSKPFGCGIGDRNQDERERERPRPSRQTATQEEFLTLSARLKQKRQNGSARPLTPQTMQRLYHTPLPITWIAAPDHEKRACVPRTHARARRSPLIDTALSISHKNSFVPPLRTYIRYASSSVESICFVPLNKRTFPVSPYAQLKRRRPPALTAVYVRSELHNGRK